uniref:Uncharacterized protein n=1 Tax=Glossina palpalis gambiensis TaxID=67801 RepID=A0A1B0C1W6_9MUSC
MEIFNIKFGSPSLVKRLLTMEYILCNYVQPSDNWNSYHAYDPILTNPSSPALYIPKIRFSHPNADSHRRCSLTPEKLEQYLKNSQKTTKMSHQHENIKYERTY